MLTLALTCATAQAQDTPTSSGAWTLRQCIDHALANNIELRRSEMSVEESRVNIDAGKGNIGPSLTFSTGQTLSWRPWSQSTVNLSGGTLTQTQSDVSYHGSYSLSAQWTVWDGGRKYRNLDNYRVAAEMAEEDYKQIANSIEEQIAQYYVQVLYQTEALQVQDSIREHSRMQRDRGQEMQSNGLLSVADLAKLEAQLSQDEYNVVNSNAQLQSYLLQLRQILEITDTNFGISSEGADDTAVMSDIPNYEEVYDQALSVRPEIRELQLSVSQAEIQERIARSGRLPNISLSAGVQTSHSSASSNGVGEQMKQNVNNSLGLNISVPILDNRSTSTSKAKARIQKTQSELSLQQKQKELYKQIETYWLNATTAQMQYKAAQSEVKSASESYRLTSEQFELGLKNIVDLGTAKNSLLQAEYQMLQAKYTTLLNVAMLRFYAGGELTL